MGSGSSGYNILGTRGARDASYEGGASFWHAIKDNRDLLQSSYPMSDGYCGQKSGRSKVRRIYSYDSTVTALDFYRKASFGGVERTREDGMPRIADMADGTTVVFRETSRDGSPVVEIHPPDGIDTGGIKYQKIHFTKKEG